MISSTICAVSTPRGKGGISVIRVSGGSAFEIVKKIFRSKKDIDKAKGYTILFGSVYDGDEKVDEVLVSVFKSPNSFTGENVCEISCHGGVLVTQRILNLLIKAGASHAERGEFTKRAFMNGKMSLTQAEAVHDIIEAKTARAAEMAVNNLSGALSEKINSVRDSLVKLLAAIQVSTDFPEDGIEAFTERSVKDELLLCEDKILKLINSANEGIMLANGARCAIVGVPNTGKSSLLNSLIDEEKAIVTSSAGTTRDIVEGRCEIGGIEVVFYDTAGIRESSDEIETLGIERSKKAMYNSDFVIFVTESGREINSAERAIIDDISGKKAIFVLNKCDIVREEREGFVSVSAKEKTGIDKLKDEILKILDIDGGDDAMVANERQREALIKAEKSLSLAKKTLDDGFFEDMTAIDIESAISYLGEADGMSVNDEVVDRIFRDFCLGK